MRKQDQELVTISLIKLHETDKAILVTKEDPTRDNCKKVWLPKSQVEIEHKPNSTVEVTMPEWLYEKSEFIG